MGAVAEKSEQKQEYSWFYRNLVGVTKTSKAINLACYAYIIHVFFPRFYDMPLEYINKETHHYNAAEYTQDAAKIDTSTISVSGPDFDTHIFEGFKGLSEDEAEALVDAHYRGVEEPYKLISKYHYNHPEYSKLTKDIQIPDIAIRMDPNIEYGSKVVTHFTMTIGEDYSYKQDSFTRIGAPYDNDMTRKEYDLARPMINAFTEDIREKIIRPYYDVDTKFSIASRDRKNTDYNDYKEVQASVLDKRILLLEIPRFNDNSLELTQDAVEQAQEKYGDQLEAIFIDLRDNPGGLAHITFRLIDDFTSATELGFMKHSSTDDPKYVEHAVGKIESITSLPIKILVNNESASAAEVFSGTLQDLGRAKVFGKTPTFGKGISQADFSSKLKASDARVQITLGAIYLPKSGAYQGLGIQPDVLVNMTPRDHKYDYVYMKDFPNHLPNPEGKTELAPAPYKCKTDFDYAKGEKQAWYMKDNLTRGKSYKVNLGYDETMLCALDDISETPKYSKTTENAPIVPSV